MRGRAVDGPGGARVSWVPAVSTLHRFWSLDLQVHVCGDASPVIQAICHARTLPLHVFAWHPQMRSAGFLRNAAYLIRPDGYVAIADPQAAAHTVTSYLASRKLTTWPSSTSSNPPARPP